MQNDEQDETEVIADEGGRIEVTPVMIAAGVIELANFNPREDDFETAAFSIFAAMWLLRNQ